MLNYNLITMSSKNTGVGRYVNDLKSMKNMHYEVYTLLLKADKADLYMTPEELLHSLNTFAHCLYHEEA